MKSCYVNDEMYKCVNHQWQFEQKCPSGQTCEFDYDMQAKCQIHVHPVGKPAFGKECGYNQMRCDSENAIMFCHNGFWRYKEVCKEPNICQRISDNQAKCVPPNEQNQGSTGRDVPQYEPSPLDVSDFLK